MAVAADSIRQLTRAYLGARVYQGLIFWWALALNINAVIKAVTDPSPRAQMWLFFAAVVAAGTLGSYYRWRFGRVEPPRPSLWDRPFQTFKYGVFGATALALLVITVFVLAAEGGLFADGGVRPGDLGLVMLSGATAISLATSRSDRPGQWLAAAAAAVLFATLVVPVLAPLQVSGHVFMAAVLVFNAVQLHLFLVREFGHAHV
jgi:hypothetical protein